MVDGDQPVPFLCECADDSCLAAMALTLPQCRGVRSDEARFLIVPGHQTIDGEDVVTQNETFAVVEKPVA